MELFNKLFKSGDQNNGQKNDDQSQPEQTEKQEEVTAGTKIKVVAALLVVGFAAYIAYWIQEPVEVRTDVLGSTSMQSTQGMSMQSGQTQQVSITNFSFNPASLNVDKGTTVVWTNNDQVPHNVVFENFASPTLNPGDTFSYTFNDDGTLSYRCTFHPQMKGYVIVGTGVSQSQASQDQVLSGFGAGTSLSLNTPSPSPVPPVAPPATTQTTTPAESTPPPAESVYTTTAPAPSPSPATAQDLHNAALQSLGTSLSNIGSAVSAQGSTPLYPQQTMTTAQQPQTVVAQPQTTKKGKLASSGPEDYVYAGIFGLVLFLNRKKLRKFQRAVR